jgi:hypothetical protein
MEEYLPVLGLTSFGCDEELLAVLWDDAEADSPLRAESFRWFCAMPSGRRGVEGCPSPIRPLDGPDPSRVGLDQALGGGDDAGAGEGPSGITSIDPSASSSSESKGLDWETGGGCGAFCLGGV